MEAKKQYIQWHPAFCSATELELREDKENLEFVSEHPLTQAPLTIDLMVIKKKPGVIIKNEIGHLFKTHNIIEYKNPDDQFNIDKYYKSIAYVCLYKSLGEHVDDIPIEELTLSLFHDSKPVKLMNTLEQKGYRIVEKYKGIYYIEGDLTLPKQQIVVTEEVGEGHCFFKALSRKFTIEDGRELMTFAESKINQGEKEKLDSVFQVSVVANRKIYDSLKKENIMCEAILDLFKDEIAAKIAAAEAIIREENDVKIRETEARVRSETEARVRSETEAEVKALKKQIAELRKKIVN